MQRSTWTTRPLTKRAIARGLYADTNLLEAGQPIGGQLGADPSLRSVTGAAALPDGTEDDPQCVARQGAGIQVEESHPPGWTPVVNIPRAPPGDGLERPGIPAKAESRTGAPLATGSCTQSRSAADQAVWEPVAGRHTLSLASAGQQRLAKEALDCGIVDRDKYEEVVHAQRGAAGGLVVPATRQKGGKMVLCTKGQWVTWTGEYCSKAECMKACGSVVHGDNDGRWITNPSDHKVALH